MQAAGKTIGPRLITVLVGLLSSAAAAGLFAAGRAADRPRATAAVGGFAFPDGAGGRLMLLGDAHRLPSADASFGGVLKAAGAIRTALCAGGASHPITFERRQPADGKSNGRQNSWQFDHLDGLVFAVNDGTRVAEHDACFLAADGFAKSLVITPVVSLTRKSWPPETPACDAGLTKEIALRRQRTVTQCWLLAQSPKQPGPRVVLLEFADRGKEALASIAVVDGRKVVFADQKGDRGHAESVWRIGDDGTIPPEAFRIVFLGKRGGRLVLAVHWQAEEGSVLMLFESDGDSFRQLLQESWYQMAV
jgi:hypothetical protein